MQTLSKGFKKPQTGDKGSVFFPALEDNIQQLNDHSHNGSNSQLLTASASTAVTQSISSASWSHQGGGTYRQTVTMPGVITFDTHAIELRNSATNRKLFLDVEKVTSNTYYVYVNDNTLNLTALYV